MIFYSRLIFQPIKSNKLKLPNFTSVMILQVKREGEVKRDTEHWDPMISRDLRQIARLKKYVDQSQSTLATLFEF